MSAECHWYALSTRARHEKRVRALLAEKRIEAFLPLVNRWSRWKDRKKQIEWPLFPGYCFAYFSQVSWLQVATCQGVAYVIGVDGVPSAIPDCEIDSLKRLVSTDLVYDPCPFIKTGQLVRVVSGPLQGVLGRLVRKGSHARLLLTVDLLATAVSVEVDAADVRPCT